MRKKLKSYEKEIANLKDKLEQVFKSCIPGESSRDVICAVILFLQGLPDQEHEAVRHLHVLIYMYYNMYTY